MFVCGCVYVSMNVCGMEATSVIPIDDVASFAGYIYILYVAMYMLVLFQCSDLI